MTVAIKIICSLIGINILALLIFVGASFVSASGRNVDTQEKGWIFIFAFLGLLDILLAILPLYFGHPAFAGFFAALPLVIFLYRFLHKRMPSFKRKRTMAELYYKDKTQRAIASAIEKSDIVLLRQLIEGQDLNIRGNINMDGLSYLQFAVRLWNNNDTINREANIEAIKLLVEHGAKTTIALSEAIRRLPFELISYLLDNGADPNTYGYANNDPLLFETISTTKEMNDIGILLLQKGADVNAKAANNYDVTPVMFAANNARTSHYWNDVWRFVRYMLEESDADYHYTTKYGMSLQKIICTTRKNAEKKQLLLSPDFYIIVEWLKEKQVDTDPVNETIAAYYEPS